MGKHSDDTINDLQSHLQAIKEFMEENGSQVNKKELLEKLKKLYKYTRDQSLPREIYTLVEKAIRELRPHDRKSSDSSDEWYGLTYTPPGSPANTSRRRNESDDQRRSRKEKSNKRRKNKNTRKPAKGSRKVITTLRSWMEYDERTESYLRCSSSSDNTVSEDAASKPRELSGYRSLRRETSHRIVTPEKYRSRECDRRASRSPSYRSITTNRNNRQAGRSRSRSPSRRRIDKRNRRSYSRERRDEGAKRRKSDKGSRKSRRRSRSTSRICSTDSFRRRNRRSYSHESKYERRNRSRSGSRSSRNYSLERGDKGSRKSRRRSRSTSRICSTDSFRRRNRRSYSHEREYERRNRSRSGSRSSGRYGRTSKSIERSKTQSLIWEEERNDRGLNSCVKPTSNRQSDADLSVVEIARTRMQSTFAKSSNLDKITERNVISSCRSHLYGEWRDDFALDGESSYKPPSNLTANEDTQIDSNDSLLGENRSKIQFTLATKRDKLKLSDAFVGSDNGLEDVRSKLSALIKSALIARDNDGQNNDTEYGESGHRNEPSMQFNIPGNESVEHVQTPNKSRETTIDNDIIRKVIAQSAMNASTASKLPFYVDSVEQAPTTSRMIETENVSANDDQWSSATALTKNCTVQRVRTTISPEERQPSLSVQPKQDVFRIRPYCPVSVPEWMYHDPIKVRVAPVASVLPTPNKSFINSPPISTSTPKRGLLSTFLNLPVPSPKFLQRVTFQTPAIPHHNDTSSKQSTFNTPLNSSVDQQKNMISRRSSTTVLLDKKKTPMMTYGGYKKLQDKPSYYATLDWNFKIPKTPSQKINRSTNVVKKFKSNGNTSTAIVNDPYRSQNSSQSDRNHDGSQSHTQPGRNGSQNHRQPDRDGVQTRSQSPSQFDESSLDVNYSEHENVSRPVDSQTREENDAITTLKELMSSNQLVPLVDLMKRMTQNSTVAKVKEAPKNCTDDRFTNEEDISNSSTSTSFATKMISNHNQRTKLITSPSLSATETCRETTVDESLRKQIPILRGRMTGSSVIEKPLFKNIEIGWHSLKKVLSCQVCDKPPGNSLVSHYVNEHPNSEVLVSRLAPEAADRLRSQVAHECKFLKPATSNNYHYQQICFFCNVEKSFNKNQWVTHIARHTGYYPIKCNDCSRMFASKPALLRCNTINDFAKIPQPQLQKKTVEAFVCDICNFVRFHRSEIESHLKNEHEDDVTKFKEVTFLTFPDKVRRQHQIKFPSDLESEYDTDWKNDEEEETDLDSEYTTEDESDWKSDDSDDGNDVTSETDSDFNLSPSELLEVLVK